MNFKKIIISCCLLLISHLSFSQEEIKMTIGKMGENGPEITVDKEKMMRNLERNLQRLSQLDVKFDDVSIQTSEDKQKYHLVFRGVNARSSFELELNGDIVDAFTTTTCTTTDCATSKGCDPVGGICTACENKGKCTKTKTSTNLLEYSE